MNSFFTIKDDFEEIIKCDIGDFDSIRQISTGWTNFVFRITKNSSNYIYRFPRNNFFSSVLEKEVIFTNFIQEKISFKIPYLHLLFNNNRPFSRHEEIPGKNMQEIYPSLTKDDKEKIAGQVSNFIYELQNIDISTLNVTLPTTSCFLKELSKVDNQEYDMSKLNPLINLEKEKLILSHADLNPGNILLDEHHNVCGILDFAFVSLTSELNDVARLIGRLPQDFYPIMLKQYNNRFKTKIDNSKIDDLIGVWNHVEYHYMIYMKNYHPEINFQNSQL